MSFTPEVINGLFAVGGAVVGALIAGIFAMYIAKSAKEKKEIIVSTSSPSRLLVVHDEIASDVEILVSGNKVENVVLSEIFLSNTGNKTIEDLNFPVSCQQPVQIISVNALDQASNATRPGSKAIIKSKQEFDVSVDYLNPGEEISLRCMVSGAPPQWNVSLRQPELKVMRREQPLVNYSDVAVEALFEGLAKNAILRTYFSIVMPAFKKFLKARREA